MGRVKAFVLTLDALFALMVFFLALLIGIIYLAQPETPRAIYLKQVSQDLLIIAEKNDELEAALDGDSISLRNLLRRLPPNICAQFILTDESENEIVISDPSCPGYTRELQTNWASLYHNEQPYTVRLESWYR